MGEMPEALVDEYGPFCNYCGYPADSHPIEHAELRDKTGIFCEEAVLD